MLFSSARAPALTAALAVLAVVPTSLLACGSGASSDSTGTDGHGGTGGDGGSSSTSQGSGGTGTSGGGGGSSDGGGTGTGTGTGGGSGSSDGGGGATGDAGPVTPTVSSWVGTNVDADLPLVDVTTLLTGFTAANGGTLDANGYPAAGMSGTSSTDVGFILPSGTYNISYVGTGTLAVSGIGKLAGAWQTVGTEQRNTVTITGTPGSFGNSLTLSVSNTSGQSVTGIHLYLPGTAYDPAVPFTPQFLALLTPFRALRFMDWMGTNNSKVAAWADRSSPTAFGAGKAGQPYETIAALINVTGKDAWINIPEHASDDFVTQLAALFRDQLDMTKISAARAAQGLTTPFAIYLEPANETWNMSFSAYSTFLAAAQADPATYTGTYSGSYGSFMTMNADLVKVGQYEANFLVHAAQIFRQTYTSTGKADPTQPVLSGWALGPGYSDVALQFVKAKYGDPKTLISKVATAPYFGVDDSQTGSLTALFAGLDANIDAMDATYQQFSQLVAQYGLQMAAYEGGQGLGGTTNQSLKHLAQHDQRMKDAYQRYLALWQKDFGNSLFMHFNLAGTPGTPEFIYQYGYWGSIGGVMVDTATCGQNLPMLVGTEMIPSVINYCPKYAALASHVPQ